MRKHKLKVIKGGRTRRNRIPLLLFALAMVIISVSLFWNSLGQLTIALAQHTVVRRERVDLGTAVTCVVVRAEQPLLAPDDGMYIPVAENGSRVKVGQVFARIEGADGSRDLKAPCSGLINHYPDGWEAVFVPGMLDNDAVQAAAVLGEISVPPDLRKRVAKGQVVATIVDNTGFQLLTGLDAYWEGKTHTLLIESDGREYGFTVSPIETVHREDRIWVLWRVSPARDLLATVRLVRGELITAQVEVARVPAGALTSVNGAEGVYVWQRGKTVFCPVEVVYARGQEAGVQGLKDGQVVLSLPRWASFIKRWWKK